MIIASGGTLQDKRTATPQSDTVEITPEAAKRYGVAPGPDGKFRVPKSQVRPMPEARPQAAPRSSAPHYVTGSDGSVSVVQVGPDGKPTSTVVPGVKARVPQEKADKPDKPPMGTPAQFAAVRHRKETAMQKAKDKLEKTIKAGMEVGTSSRPLTEAEKSAVLEEYNAEMRAIQQSFEEDIIGYGGSIAPRNAGGGTPAAPAGAAKTASEYLKKRRGGQ
jgi:hypothetical protein